MGRDTPCLWTPDLPREYGYLLYALTSKLIFWALRCDLVWPFYVCCLTKVVNSARALYLPRNPRLLVRPADGDRD